MESVLGPQSFTVNNLYPRILHRDVDNNLKNQTVRIILKNGVALVGVVQAVNMGQVSPTLVLEQVGKQELLTINLAEISHIAEISQPIPDGSSVTLDSPNPHLAQFLPYLGTDVTHLIDTSGVSGSSSSAQQTGPQILTKITAQGLLQINGSFIVTPTTQAPVHLVTLPLGPPTGTQGHWFDQGLPEKPPEVPPRSRRLRPSE